MFMTTNLNDFIAFHSSAGKHCIKQLCTTKPVTLENPLLFVGTTAVTSYSFYVHGE